MDYKTNKYQSLKLDRYNGKFQILVGSLWSDGSWHQDFKQVKQKDGSTKNYPVTITFDEDQIAVEFFKRGLEELKEIPSQSQTDDIPF